MPWCIEEQLDKLPSVYTRAVHQAKRQPVIGAFAISMAAG
jgi:hypothetical protein